ncbi:MAG: 50S ribosomal protein L9 [Deltaproteobacteria bacterium]|nr:MAG: 50S ribosomal protein L9 [Deltaproteobacteria bacterium]TMB30799.1 MAG: 50S ribosomal protein L9 [Deltaproteobacteria bacterium]TMB32115.1 MAG: 50S ribosomal protein L9 [Deltaproteobacteria bacterium]
MKVILTKDLENVGKAGALVDVKPGFGRNYLLPRQLAMPATAKNIRQLEHEKSGILARAARQRTSMDAMAKKISAIQLKFTRKVGEQDKLFGSVTSKDVHDRLVEQGYEIDRKQIHLPEPLKTIGDHEVEVKLHPDVTAKLKVAIAAEQ